MSNLYRLKPVPGENFSVPLDDETKMMKPEFSAQEVDLEDKKNQDMISAFTKLDTEKVQYKKLKISELENVLKCVGPVSQDVSNLQSNLIIMTGDPGVGKTTAAQRFAWMWAKGLGILPEMYKFVFFIPVRDVEGKDVSLSDVLSCLKLLPDHVAECFQSLSNHAKDILFILDGADENDIIPELFNLITGKSFPESTVLMTARPEAKCFKTISVLPRVKVTLLGTDAETVERYIKEAVSPASDEEWKSFEDNYKEKIYDRSLLYIPLYLTLLCAVFKAHIAEGLKLKVPASATELFNAFLEVILKRWLDKSSDPTDFRFTISPLPPESSVPVRIKRCLCDIGKLCYTDLTEPRSKYEFTDTQASEFLLDMQDIKNSGLFTVGKSGSQEIFFLRHKQLQEYLAALYLSFEGVKESKFNNILSNNKGDCLALVMRDCKLIQVVQFACGLSDKFYTSLLDVAASEFSMMKSNKDQIDVYYEAALFTERHPGDLLGVNVESLEGFAVLKRYVFNATQKRVENRAFNFLIKDMKSKQSLSFYEKCLQKLAKLFDIPLSVELLSSLYEIGLTPVTSDQSTVFKLKTYIVTSDNTPSDPVNSASEPSDSSPSLSGSQDPVTSDPANSGCVSSLVSRVHLCLDQIQKRLPCALCMPTVQNVNLSFHDVSEHQLHTDGVTSDSVPFLSRSPDAETSDAVIPGPVSSPVCKLRLQLDQLQTELLSAVCVHGVQSVGVPSRDVYVDLPALLATFPHLTELDVMCRNYRPYQSSARSDREIGTALTHVRLWSRSDISLPQTHVESLLKQSGLTHLMLVHVSILPALSDTQLHPSLWSHLQYLRLNENISDLPMCEVIALQKVLEASCNTLTKCGLSVHRVDQHSVGEIKEGLKTLQKLEKLTLVITLSDESEVTVEILVSVLSHLTSLHSLDVVYDRVEHHLTDLVEVVCSHGVPRKFYIMRGLDKLSPELIHKLQSEGIEVTGW